VPTDGKKIVQFYIRTDHWQNTTYISRYDWITSIGSVFGLKSFYAMFIFFFLDHFTGIDYLTTVIKRIFLERSSNEKFFL
jgi:hypothetical protein